MKTFKEYLKEMGAGAVGGVGPTNVVGSGDIAGTGGKGGEPGVNRKRKAYNPVMMGVRRK